MSRFSRKISFVPWNILKGYTFELKRVYNEKHKRIGVNSPPQRIERKIQMKTRILSLFAVLTFSANAATLLSWDTSGIPGGVDSPTTLASNFNATNIGASNLLAGSGLLPLSPNDSGRFQFTSWNTDGILANAMSNGDYLEFTITADAGYHFTLNTIDVYWRNRAGTTPAYDLVLVGSHNNYDSAVATMAMPEGNAQQSFTNVDISSITPSELTSVTLRLAVLGVDNLDRPISLTGNGSNPELLIDGTVSVIPEPSTLALLGIALGAAALMRRRK
jgi:hypothetical protein